jgi:hypothetical protein
MEENNLISGAAEQTSNVQTRASKAAHPTVQTAARVACALWYKIQVYDLKSYMRPTDNGVLLHMRGGLSKSGPGFVCAFAMKIRPMRPNREEKSAALHLKNAWCC